MLYHFLSLSVDGVVKKMVHIHGEVKKKISAALFLDDNRKNENLGSE